MATTTLPALDDLRDVLELDPGQDDPAGSSELARRYGLPTAHGVLDWTELPTFGGEVPVSTVGVWSWDADRLLVGTCASDLRIVARAERRDPGGRRNAPPGDRRPCIDDGPHVRFGYLHQREQHALIRTVVEAWSRGARSGSACPYPDEERARWERSATYPGLFELFDSAVIYTALDDYWNARERDAN